jgi:hypothetical protein
VEGVGWEKSWPPLDGISNTSCLRGRRESCREGLLHSCGRFVLHFEKSANRQTTSVELSVLLRIITTTASNFNMTIDIQPKEDFLSSSIFVKLLPLHPAPGLPSTTSEASIFFKRISTFGSRWRLVCGLKPACSSRMSHSDSLEARATLPKPIGRDRTDAGV